ncbi:MAG: 30S ribosome-binding factor RbfA [Bifidobacteriaceae bacterium]|jgi:ribosome-binding factor A|nr:30S ribosome-binding factor RbfA [Bifidobacteriaceae bacterium]
MEINSPKKQRLEHIIRSVVAKTIEFDLKDSRLGLITVLDVKVTGDFKHAKIYWSVLGKNKTVNENTKALNSAKGRIRTVIAKQINLQSAPSLEFIYDKVEQTVKSLDKLINKAHKTDLEISQKASQAKFANSSNAYKKPI